MTRSKSTLSQPSDTMEPDPFTRPDNAASDVREVARREYPFRQRYALYREGRWPSAEEFHAAELCDISSKGLALHLDDRPAAEMMVVELGVGANVSQVLVKVVQVCSISVAGHQGYRVGCEFVSTGSAS